ncbi:uncharacterized protein VTP21DRAFT_5194 [Calcarisporiella thermophila]|uniref:uncharacterized protein n=1 Tax=Calcarisporiella thermophila TaxID=911321 RepID=UPI00374428A6
MASPASQEPPQPPAHLSSYETSGPNQTQEIEPPSTAHEPALPESLAEVEVQHDPVESLYAMFPELDREVIQDVLLGSCKGDMQRAAELLLSLTDPEAYQGESSMARRDRDVSPSSSAREAGRRDSPQPSDWNRTEQTPPPITVTQVSGDHDATNSHYQTSTPADQLRGDEELAFRLMQEEQERIYQSIRYSSASSPQRQQRPNHQGPAYGLDNQDGSQLRERITAATESTKKRFREWYGKISNRPVPKQASDGAQGQPSVVLHVQHDDRPVDRRWATTPVQSTTLIDPAYTPRE